MPYCSIALDDLIIWSHFTFYVLVCCSVVLYVSSRYVMLYKLL